MPALINHKYCPVIVFGTSAACSFGVLIYLYNKHGNSIPSIAHTILISMNAASLLTSISDLTNAIRTLKESG